MLTNKGSIILLVLYIFFSSTIDAQPTKEHIPRDEIAEETIPAQTPQPPSFGVKGPKIIESEVVELHLDSYEITGSAFLWENKMPTTDSSPELSIRGVVSLFESSSAEFPKSIEVTSIGLRNLSLNEDYTVNSWEIRPGGNGKLEVVLQDTPQWKSGEIVEVAVGLLNGKTGKNGFFEIKNLNIQEVH